MDQNTQAIMEQVIESLRSHRAMDVKLLDVSAVTSLTEAFILATGNSDVHMRTLCESVTECLEKKGIQYQVEGERSTQWALVDTPDFIVHIFGAKAREFYKLDRIWGDVPTKSYENID